MEKTADETTLIINENEKVIANILHDIKSPLYSIKIGLQNRLNNELNREIFKTIIDTIEYIENFLVNYSFKLGKFENNISICDIKKIINQKIENCKQILIEKNICIDFAYENQDYCVSSIEIFLSSIIGNIISNIACHASENQNAYIEIIKKSSGILIIFENLYSAQNNSFSLGLDFCQKLTRAIKADIKFLKTKEKVIVELKIPNKIN